MSTTTVVPKGTGTASFKVPRAWDNNAPKFTTEDADDLRDFIDQVNEICLLANITDEEEKKKLMTSYLPSKKRSMWRDLDSYSTGTYDEFLKEVYKSYPELKNETEGTLKDLERLCNKYKGITLHEEGKLKRFGMEFRSLVKKLSIEPAVILNKGSCQLYLNTLDVSFANILRGSISARNLLKEEFKKAQGTVAGAVAAPVAPAGAAPLTIEHRKEDPILLKDLVDMAEQLAATGVTGTTWEENDAITVKRSSIFPMVKVDKNDERFEELGSELASLKDTLTVARKEAQASQAELLKAFQAQLRGPPPHMDGNRNSSNGNSGGPSGENRGGNSSTYDRPYRRDGGDRNDRNRYNSNTGCFYCEGDDHYSRECPVKNGHIVKRWAQVEDGQLKLGDGNPIPRGRGSASQRVEEYWQKKSVGQHMYSSMETFYNGSEGEELDSVWDELKTLRVRLNQVAGVQAPQVVQPTYAAQVQPVQPAYMAQTQAPVQVASAAVQPALGTAFGNEIAQAIYNLMQGGGQAHEQFVTTRGGKESAGPSSQGF
jgi:hypothetical protein